MKPARRKRAARSPILSWRPDARVRLKLLLPELVVSIVATTCLSVIMAYSEDAPLPALLAASGVIQTLLQSLLYVYTYLSEDDSTRTNAYWFRALVGMCVLYGILIPLLFGLPQMSGSPLRFFAGVSAGFGFVLFYLTRTRPTFVMLLIEILVMVDALDDLTVLLPLHVIGVSAIATLFVMRSSASRIVLHESAGGSEVMEEDNGTDASPPVVSRQVATLGVTVGALCLAMALAGTPQLWRGNEAGGDVPTTQTQVTSDPEEPSPTVPPGQGGAGTPQAESGVATEEGGQVAGNQAETHPRSSHGVAWVLAFLVLAALALPLPLRLLMRRLARHSLEREPKAADHAARIYQAIIARLEAAGIVRGETETPRAFLSSHRSELEELTAVAGIGPDAWEKLTSCYEKARYAGLDPTDDELATCWRIYDALPTCTRTAVGWRTYLAGPFWHQ